MAPAAITSNAPHNDAIVVDEQFAMSDSGFESKKLDAKQPLLVNVVEAASPLHSEQPSPINGGQTSPMLEDAGTTAAQVLEASATEASETPTATEVSEIPTTTGASVAIEKDILVDDSTVQVPQEKTIPTIVDFEAPAFVETAAAPVVAPAVQASGLVAPMVPGTKLPASTRLQNMIKETDELIVCPGVYDGLSARTAIEVGFDSLYMV